MSATPTSPVALIGPRWVSAALITIATAAMLAMTWETWPDVLVDFGRELYPAWRITHGDVLTRDIAWLSGPLSPYVNAFWFLVFGEGLRSVVFGNLMLVAILLWLIFQLIATAANRLAATMACLTFVLLFGFGQLVEIGNYNFLTPYSHDVTHGVILAFVAIWCLVEFVRTGRTVALAGAGLAFGMVFLTKADVFIATGVALGSGITAALRLGAIRAHDWQRVGIVFVAPAFLPPIAAAAWFAVDLPFVDAARAATGAWSYVFGSGLSSFLFYRRIAGLVDPAASLRVIATSAALYALIFGAATLAAFAARARDRSMTMGAGFAGGVLMLGAASHVIAWNQAARPLPLFMIGLAVACVRTIFRAPRAAGPSASHPRLVAQITLITFSAALLLRILLNTVFYHYGFALAMPATIVTVAALFAWIPARIRTLGGGPDVFRSVAAGAWCVLIGVHLVAASAHASAKSVVVGEGRDRFRADARGNIVNDVVRDVQSRLGTGETLLVMPEGVMINYLTRRVNPTPYLNFMPPELAAFGEDRMIASLNAHPPDYVAIVHKDTSEYGPQFFGRDYGVRLRAWVAARYQPVRLFGSPPLVSQRFGIELERRK